MKIVYGKTFEIKDEIKSCGGKWNSQEKRWEISEENFKKLEPYIEAFHKSQPNLNLSGQLWEPCERCNKEPIYMSHGCCETCAGRKRIHSMNA